MLFGPVLMPVSPSVPAPGKRHGNTDRDRRSGSNEHLDAGGDTDRPMITAVVLEADEGKQLGNGAIAVTLGS